MFWYGTAEWNKSSPLIYKTDKGTTIMKGKFTRGTLCSLACKKARTASYITVDDTSSVIANEWHTTKRFAPKLLSKRAYGVGTVWVLDALHLPYGCSVWPAFWTVGPKWPVGELRQAPKAHM